MKSRMTLWLGSFAILALSVAARAQDVAAVGVAAPAAAAPAAAAGPNLFTMLLPPPEMRERCRQKLCKCELVKMLGSAATVSSTYTGGLTPKGNCCPQVKKEDLAKPPDSTEGAAARIKKDLEESAARREAVRFLGTVDCRYWPEAEDALIAALRADKIECVRYEAAVVLQRGCCCTKKIARALTICIEGTELDGFPAERSVRVQDAAAMALGMCVFEDQVEIKEKEKDPIVKKKTLAKANPKEFYKNVENADEDAIVDGARKALQKRGPMSSAAVLSQSHRAASYGLFGIFNHAIESSAEPATAMAPMPQAAPAAPAPVAMATVQSPQRRGLLYKFMGNSTAANTPTPVAEEFYPMAPPATIIPAAATMPAGPLPQPSMTMPPVQALPPVTTSRVPTEIRMPRPAFGTMSEEPSEVISTATQNPRSLRPLAPATSLPPLPASAPPVAYPAPRTAPPLVPPPPTSLPTSPPIVPATPPQGLLGFVTLDETPPTRR